MSDSGVGTSRTGIPLRLVGEDGNAHFILGKAMRALRQSDASQTEIDAFQAEATSGDYEHLLATCMEWFDVS